MFKTTFPVSSGVKLGDRLTVGRTIDHNAEMWPAYPAIVSPNFAPLTYRDLQHQISEVRLRLREAGFDCHARIGVLMPNSPEAVLAIVAVACCAVAVPLDPRLTAAEIDQRFDMLGLSALLLPQGSNAGGRQAAERRNVAIIEADPVVHGKLELRLAIQACGFSARDDEPDPQAPAFILQTSGTTAQPKLIPFSHANMLAAAARLQTWFDLTPQDRCLSVSPPFYSHGLKVTVFTPLLIGGSIALPADATVVDLPKWFSELRPTWYSAAPTLHRAVLDLATNLADVKAMHSLRFVVSGGAPLPNELREDLQQTLGVPVLEHYGSSEAAQIAANRPGPGLSRPGTCGKPWPDTVVVVDTNGNQLSPGAEGEILVRGATLTSGYLDAPDLNRQCFVNGWFHTGDLGSLDQDGFLSVHGRLSELINRGSEKVAPVEVDAALQRHPAVTEAAAFAVPHLRLGEDVAAAVVLRHGAQTTPAELRQFLKGSLSSFKIPHRIVILDQLPKGRTGKVQRRQLSAAHGAVMSEPAAQDPPSPSHHPLTLKLELLKLWRRLLQSEAITIDDDFFDSGGDSLLATQMLIEVEKLLGHPIPEAILFGAETIRQFMPKIIEQASIPADPCTDFDANGNCPPLFFFHGDFTNGGLAVRRLVRLVRITQPIVTIDPHGLRGEQIPQTIEEMASDRLRFILKRQSGGPFFLGGLCNGALVAFEVARLLVAAGHEVAMVAMVDPPTISARPVMRVLLRLLRHRVSPDRLAWVYEQMNRCERVPRLPLKELWATLRGFMTKSSNKTPISSGTKAYTVVMARYVPAPLEVPVIFYSAAHDGRAWRHLSTDLEVTNVSGGHWDCLEVGVESLVSHLRHRIELYSR